MRLPSWKRRDESSTDQIETAEWVVSPFDADLEVGLAGVKGEPMIKRFDVLPEVELRGEPLSRPIYWLGLQWAVTAYGVECRDGRYHLAWDAVYQGEPDYPWEFHMVKKDWVDILDFSLAMEFSRRTWPIPCQIIEDGEARSRRALSYRIQLNAQGERLTWH